MWIILRGSPPAISIDQKTTSNNPRSTVGTVTEIYDYLRLLFARIGKVHCYKCGQAISQQTVEQMVDRIMTYPEGTRLQILAPLVRGGEKVSTKSCLRISVRKVMCESELTERFARLMRKFN